MVMRWSFSNFVAHSTDIDVSRFVGDSNRSFSNAEADNDMPMFTISHLEIMHTITPEGSTVVQSIVSFFSDYLAYTAVKFYFS